jgi:hypothetical protein
MWAQVRRSSSLVGGAKAATRELIFRVFERRERGEKVILLLLHSDDKVIQYLYSVGGLNGTKI